MTTEFSRPRLAVVARIMGSDDTGPIAAAARLGHRFRTPTEVPVASATTTERELARALQGDTEQDGDPPGERAMAELLLLAGDIPEPDKLAAALSQALLLPDDSRPALARAERRSAFADLYRRLALHHLNSQVRNKAAAMLGRLDRR
jgi:hypothetical protein